MQRVLAPVDFSACSEYALEVASQWALRHQAELRLLHVHPVVDVATMDFTAVQPTDRLDTLVAALEHQLDGWSQKVPLPRERIRKEVALGAPVEEIIKRSHEASLVVLGTHGRSGVSRFLLGSVAERVVQGAACSVFIAKRPRI
jgi:nucleotide-binding universal stress UspA family protein